MRRLITLLTFILVCTFVGAEVSFSSLDLSATDQLLFTATTNTPEWGAYRTLLYADLSRVSSATASTGSVAGGDVLSDVNLVQLTHFPEIMTFLPELNAVQIQNRFGLFRASVSEGVFSPVSGFDSFADGAAVPNGRIVPVTASPDGRYLVVLEPTSPAYGRMLLRSTQTGEETIVAEGVELTVSDPPARWSPDSAFFIYAHEASLYYYSISQHERGRLLGESFRQLGSGTLSSVRWAPDASLYYVSGNLVYRILGAEFFTRSLYAGLLEIGTIVGKIPFPFDPSFDSFWIAPDGQTAILNKGGRNLFVLFLNTDDFVDEGQILGLPSLFLPRNTRVAKVLWSEFNDITVLATGIQSGIASSSIFRLRIDPSASNMVFTRTLDESVRDISLSPNQSRVVLLTDTSIVIRDHTSWALQRNIPVAEPLHAVWTSDSELLVGGRYTIDRIDTRTASAVVLSLSQAQDHAVGDAGEVFALNEDVAYQYRSGWAPAVGMPDQNKRVSSGNLRVFLESLSSGTYRNIVMIRRTRSVGTSRLFEPPVRTYEPFPAADDPIDFSSFSQGSRTRRREVSFVFNAVDSVEGLTDIINTLAAYGVTATFFVNGEFIKRHSEALRQVTDAGHEVGSLFFAYFDMSDRRYRITEEFIRDGLSRNEDDYFNATGNELSLLWHAPFYFVSDTIIDAGMSANYIYVGRDVDSLDWVPRRTDEGLSQLYMPSSMLVERVLDLKRPGSIISMQVGISDEARGGRDDYLFQKLDILINGLLEDGYDVVPVSTLIEHAR